MTDFCQLTPTQIHGLLMTHNDAQDQDYSHQSQLKQTAYQLDLAHAQASVTLVRATGMLAALKEDNTSISLLDVHELITRMKTDAQQQTELVKQIQSVLTQLDKTRNNYERQYPSLSSLLESLSAEHDALVKTRKALYQFILKVCGQPSDSLDRNAILPDLDKIANILELSVEVKPMPDAALSTETPIELKPPVVEAEFVARYEQTTTAKELFALLNELTQRGYSLKEGQLGEYEHRIRTAIHKFTHTFLKPAITEAVENYTGKELCLAGYTRPQKWGFENPYLDWNFGIIKDASILNESLPTWELEDPVVDHEGKSWKEVISSNIDGNVFESKRAFFDSFGFKLQLPKFEKGEYANNPDFAAVVDLYVERAKSAAESTVNSQVERAENYGDEIPGQILNSYSSQRAFAYLKTLPHDYPVLVFSDYYGYEYTSLVLPISVLEEISRKLDLPEMFHKAHQDFELKFPRILQDW